jgi:predicted nucleic acid-binding protein
MLHVCERLTFEVATDFDGAVRIYRRCRESGVTPRGLLDCMIATVARRTRAVVLAQDVDFARIADVAGLELDPASPT